MGISYSIDEAARIVRVVHSGDSPIEEYEAVLTAIFCSPLFQPGFAFLIDRRRFESPPAAFVRRLIEFLNQNRRSLAGARWAVVVESPAGYGMGRMGQMLAEGTGDAVTVCVFRDVGEAESWLRNPSPEK